MIIFKPFLRITILSIILASLLIYLGVKYHWGDTLKRTEDVPLGLTIPEQKSTNHISTKAEITNDFSPVIIKNNKNNSLLESMNKEQITEHCVNLLSKQIKDSLSLELATVNCVVSNYHETFQNVKKAKKTPEVEQQQLLIMRQCQNELDLGNQYSSIENQLLFGICISDKQNQN